MPVSKRCLLCDKEFFDTPSEIKIRKYCSVICVRKSRTLNKVCERCRKDFPIPPCKLNTVRYCSISCKYAERMQKACKYCGKSISVIASQIESKIYCSNNCRLIDRHPPKIICPACASPFQNLYGKKNASKYCSRDCHRAAISKGTGKICLHCKQVFRITPYYAETKHYCSNDCYVHARSYAENRIKKKCLNCEIEFLPKHKGNITYRKAKFCTKKCSDLYSRGQFVERFWAKVDKSENCWIWHGGRDTSGYGNFSGMVGKRKKRCRAHRVAYELTYASLGSTPSKLFVCHTCDNPSCVRPEHLFLGTQQNNTDDMVAKGRSARGERSSHAKLNNKKVREIRSSYRNGCLGKTLAKKFNVTPTCISNIVLYKSWKHIK